MELGVGKVEINFVLDGDDGRPVSLSSLRGEPVLLVYYKGGYCPYCRRELERLSDAARPYLSMGLAIYGISADPVETSASTRQELAVPFPLLSDPDEHVVTRCRVGHCLVLLDAAGVVRWAAFTENWRDAAPYDRVLQAAVRLSREKIAIATP